MTPGAARSESPPDPVDWGTARRVAALVARSDPLTESYLGDSLHSDFAAVTEKAHDLVAEFTGLRAPGGARAEVLDRGRWVDANVASMRRMLDPLVRRFAERLARNPFAPVSRQVAGTELGVLLGFLSQRVLGQYDPLFVEAGGRPHGDAVFYVGPNVLSLEKRFAFRPRDFRTWLALHEVTHRAQFTGVPWMREHFLSLVAETVALVDPDPRALLRALRRAAEDLAAGRNPLDDGGIAAFFATPEQRVVLTRIQALMSLLEGHGNYVMDELGRRHVAGQPRMAQVLQARRRAGGLGAQISKLFGLEAKLRQYEVGERFVRSVVDQAGPRAFDAVWRSPETLPTLAELDRPPDWLARVG